MAVPVLPEGAGLGFQLVDHLLHLAEPVAAGIVPDRGKDHCRGEELFGGQLAGTAGQGAGVLGQAPAGIEWLAENPGAVAMQDRLEPQLGRDGVDRRRPGQKVMRRDRVGQEPHSATGIGGGEMAATEAGRGFGMGADQDRAVGMILQGGGEHPGKIGGGRAGMVDSGVALGLVDDKDIAAVGDREGWIKIVVF